MIRVVSGGRPSINTIPKTDTMLGPYLRWLHGPLGLPHDFQRLSKVEELQGRQRLIVCASGLAQLTSQNAS